jgi:hypothetical protein
MGDRVLCPGRVFHRSSRFCSGRVQALRGLDRCHGNHIRDSTTILVFQAFPQGWSKIQILRQNWTWWHPLWFLIFFSMLVFRIRDVGAAKANPLDAWAMTRVLPEAFVSLALLIRLLLKKPNWMRALFTGIPGAMAVYCLVCVVGERLVDRLQVARVLG